MEMKGTNESEKKMGSDAENLQTLSISVLDDKIKRNGDQRKTDKKSSKPREGAKFLIALGMMESLVYRALRKVPYPSQSGLWKYPQRGVPSLLIGISKAHRMNGFGSGTGPVARQRSPACNSQNDEEWSNYLFETIVRQRSELVVVS